MTASHEHPENVLTTTGDLFAFGSVLYEIMTGDIPYATLPDHEIYTLFAKGEFPDTAFLKEVGDIIRHCWQSKYAGAEAAIKDLKKVGTFICFQSNPKPTNIE